MKIQILIIGRHEEIVETLLRMIHKNEGWLAEAAFTNEAAIQLFDSRHFDIVLLSSGINETCEQYVCDHFRKKDPSVIIIQHYGGGSGLLSNEILEALDKKTALFN